MKNIPASAVQTLSVRAKELAQQGKDVVNLTSGEPSWDSFDWCKKKAQQAIDQGCSKYSPAGGQPKLKQAIAEDLNRHLNLHFQASQVTVSIGAKYICYSALQALVNPGDEVLIPAPYWVSYPPMVDLIGAKKIIVETDPGTHKLSKSILQKHLTAKSRVLILNSPNNPTGAVYSLEELKEIGECLKQWKSVFILTDDIYNRMDLTQPSTSYAPHILSACPELKDRTIIVNAASKNYAMPGWRLGWAAGPQPLIQAMSAFQSHTVSSAPTISQMVMTGAFKNTESDVQRIHAMLLEKRKKMGQALSSLKGIQYQEPAGSFYLWLDVRPSFGKKYKDCKISSSMDVFRILCDDFALFTVPGEEFGRAGFLRLHFAVSDSDIEKSASCLKKWDSYLV